MKARPVRLPAGLPFAPPAGDAERRTGRARARHVVLLTGGRSSERDVALASARAVEQALAASRGRAQAPESHETVIIEPDGRWRVGDGCYAAGEALERLERTDVFFLALHGGSGEDGTLQGFLDTCGKRYTGSGVAASAVAMDKAFARALAQAAGVRVAPGAVVSPTSWGEPGSRRRRDCERRLAGLAQPGPDGGWSVKPRRGGSSVATSLFDDCAELAAALEQVFATGDEALVEQRVHGVEVTCAVLGNREPDLRVLPPVEIQPRAGRFFDYQQKYSRDGAREVCPPESLASGALQALQEAALSAHLSLGCRGYSRADFIVPESLARAGAGHADPELPVFLELNTLPGLTERSLLPLAAAQAGIDFPALVLRLIELALERPD
jgi:D-alanine-D-alanine ligase